MDAASKGMLEELLSLLGGCLNSMRCDGIKGASVEKESVDR